METKRAFLEMQGFGGLSDEEVRRLDPWVRLAPAVCLVWTLVGTVLASPLVLWLLVPFALLGVVLPVHPFDAPYHFAVRRLTGGPAIPRYRAPRRFACGVAGLWVTATAVAFTLGATTVGSVLGYALVVVAAVPVTTGFCAASAIWNRLFARRGGPPHDTARGVAAG
ncbi:MAG TPA: DUF4395 family protein [Thermoanaerobaculia bacterium]